MTRTTEKLKIEAVLRPMGLLVLILVFVFQLMAPSANAAASALDSHAHHQVMSDMTSDCPMHLAKMASAADAAPEHDVTPENCAHCAKSTCCLHVAVPPSDLVAVAILLPGSQLLDRGSATVSSAGSAQERPPRHI